MFTERKCGYGFDIVENRDNAAYLSKLDFYKK